VSISLKEPMARGGTMKTCSLAVGFRADGIFEDFVHSSENGCERRYTSGATGLIS
jgi:hypothetical protein